VTGGGREGKGGGTGPELARWTRSLPPACDAGLVAASIAGVYVSGALRITEHVPPSCSPVLFRPWLGFQPWKKQ
jgi:hypothetical protein